MSSYIPKLNPIHPLPSKSPWKKGDYLVLFGELFQRGYANGLVDEAHRIGMTLIKGTVGRREKEILRPLNAEELSQVQDTLINVPLEAGFDLEPNSEGLTPVDYLKDIKLNEWENAKLDWTKIEDSRQRGIQRFKSHPKTYFQDLEKIIQPENSAGKNILFAHLMAGGVPRAKIIMPLMNRVFKGSGDRHIPSEKFWNSDLGKLCKLSFEEVTAETYRYFIELSAELREKIIKAGGHVSYLAYGYHGTEILINEQIKWQTYTPYLQGWAKMKLEEISFQSQAKGINSCVYNCPEILTNSSSIFQGVEVSLYPLLFSLEKTGSTKNLAKVAECIDLLKTEASDSTSIKKDLKKILNTYLTDSEILSHCVFEHWPQHSSKNQMEKMLTFSDKLVDLHKDNKKLITFVLSEVVFQSCGYVMLHDCWKPKFSVAWIGHDIIAEAQDQLH